MHGLRRGNAHITYLAKQKEQSERYLVAEFQGGPHRPCAVRQLLVCEDLQSLSGILGVGWREFGVLAHRTQPVFL